MADIRINALATTATTPASDDYLALDGTAQGTRKILATNIANNVTDVILGSSGPSVKSSLSARAPRQGLVFDRSAGGYGTISGVPAFSVGTVAAWVSQNLASVNDQASVFGTGSVVLDFPDATHIRYYNGSAYSVTCSAFEPYKTYFVVWVFDGTNLTAYKDGISQGSVAFSGTVPALTNIGYGAGANIFKGTISGSLVYNRALSASEVVALYEAGAPAGADYNSASNTNLNGDPSLTDNGFWTKIGGATISAGVATVDNAGKYIQWTAGLVGRIGKRLSITVTTTAGTAQFADGAGYNVDLPSGTRVDILIPTTAAQNLIITGKSGTTTITSINIIAAGLLLAPDAAQAGGGLVWYDTSGNAANITLPASGVSWNVPSSRVLGGNWSVSGTYNGTSGLLNIGTGVLDAELVNLAAATDGVGLSLLSTKTGGRRYFIVSSGGTSGYGQGKLVFGDETVGAYMALASTGNFLIGKTIDSSNGKLQLADHTTSAGGIGFGTGMALYLTSTYDISLDALAGNPILRFRNAGTEQFRLESSGSQAYFTASNSIIMRSAGVTALTLDSSQNATFAGDVYIASGKVLKGNGNLYLDSVSSNVIIRPAGSEMVSIDNALTTLSNKLCISNAVTPASASATGTTGTIVWDASYIYVCTATNTWKRVAIATW